MSDVDQKAFEDYFHLLQAIQSKSISRRDATAKFKELRATRYGKTFRPCGFESLLNEHVPAKKRARGAA